MLFSAVASQSQASKNIVKQYGPTKSASAVYTARQFEASADLDMANVNKGDVNIAKAKATRPLNSFMIFRSHYSQIFNGMQQKDISSNVTNLWKHDPFKAKWTILAKAYSVIRDASGKQNTPLNKFILLNGPYIGILSSENYLSTLGWELCVVDDQLKLFRMSEVEFASLDEGFRTTNLSVDNIIAYSIDMGYVAAECSGLPMQPNEPSMHGGSTGTNIVAVGMSTTIATGSNANISGSNIVLNTPTTATTGATNDAWLAATIQQIIDEDVADEAAESVADNDDISLIMLSSEFYALETEYPFNEEFEPDRPAFEFDPYMGDAFNAYNIGDFTEGNAFAFQY
ncbi:hypothetical protein MMC26_007475 [Xylographa opegraphella]|nr:hypothetical protein [Xylographa opegraphella]